MARTNFPKKVQREAITRAAGRFEGLLPTGERCPCRLQVGRFQVDHVVPDALGGPSILSNAQVLCTDCHDRKTQNDRKRIDKAKRQSDAHHGIRDPHARPIAGGQPLPSGRPAQRATAPLSKPLPPRRSLYVSGSRQ
ncbi:HNH endonuclease [Methylobacterium currus]|uniref:HNH endonuclease signature motif containing protein n=1 Tax=Methylobacterium currus TaxID=2051553 RepID=UPI001E29573D|nr:HNH endonuclease signature motif containing protein [Methylobacterium currus]UHC14372.1 HNH endonuclease [Methylobacterium currus]